MDDEHKILVEKINALVTALDRRGPDTDIEELMSVFGDLAQYTAEHFADEERYMESIGYPQLGSHRRIHRSLLEQVGVFGKSLRSGALDDTKLVSFLRNWLLSHIMGVDMQYAAHAKGKTRTAAKRA